MNFPFGTNEKFIILGVPILKHIKVMIIIILKWEEFGFTILQSIQMMQGKWQTM